MSESRTPKRTEKWTSAEVRAKHKEFLFPSVGTFYEEPVCLDSGKGALYTGPVDCLLKTVRAEGLRALPGRHRRSGDGSEEQGLFWATEKALFLASVRGAPGKLGPTEAFLYGFEAK